MLSNFKIFTRPNSLQTMTITIEPGAIGSREFSRGFELNVRRCVIGEQQTKDPVTDKFICSPCPVGYYILRVPEDGTIEECKVCNPDSHMCLGGSKVGPRPGYWRKSNVTNKFFKCPNPEACIGYTTPAPNSTEASQIMGYNQTGWCAEGYYGAFCSSCLPNYRQTSKNNCEKCASKLWQGL